MVYFLLKMLKKSRIKQKYLPSSNLLETTNKLKQKQQGLTSKVDRWDFDDFNEKCRACLENGELPIFGNDRSNILEAMKIISGLEIEENDDLPKLLCNDCYSLLQAGLIFRQLVLESDRILKNQKQTQNSSSLQVEYLAEDFSCDDDKPLSSPSNKIVKSKRKHNTKTNYKRKVKPQLNVSDKHGNNKTEIDLLPKAKGQNVKTQCAYCNKEITKYYYKEHLALHGFGTPKPKPKKECKICKKTIEKAYYKQHVASVHGKDYPKYVCHVCGKTFKYQSGYNSHILSHGNDFPFKCHLCPYRGRYSGLLQTHMRVHTRDYRFQCTACPARFLTSGNLNKHALKHKERSFKCTSCSRAFHSKIDQERHFQVDHLGIKNHICNICDKAFGYRSAMMKHQLHVHKRQKLLNGRVPSYIEAERMNQDLQNTTEEQET